MGLAETPRIMEGRQHGKACYVGKATWARHVMEGRQHGKACYGGKATWAAVVSQGSAARFLTSTPDTDAVICFFRLSSVV